MTKDGFLKIIDFGTATAYLNKDGKPREEGNAGGFQGSSSYASIRALENKN